MKNFLDKFEITDRPDTLSLYFEKAKAEYARRGEDIMDFEKFPAFSEMSEDIRRIKNSLVSDSDNVLYAYFLSEAIKANDTKAISAISAPKKQEKSELYDSIPLFSLLDRLPSMVEEHKRRGIPEDVTLSTIGMFENQVGDFIKLNGRIGLSDYVGWMLGFVQWRIIGDELISELLSRLNFISWIYTFFGKSVVG